MEESYIDAKDESAVHMKSRSIPVTILWTDFSTFHFCLLWNAARGGGGDFFEEKDIKKEVIFKRGLRMISKDIKKKQFLKGG